MFLVLQTYQLVPLSDQQPLSIICQQLLSSSLSNNHLLLSTILFFISADLNNYSHHQPVICYPRCQSHNTENLGKCDSTHTVQVPNPPILPRKHPSQKPRACHPRHLACCEAPRPPSPILTRPCFPNSRPRASRLGKFTCTHHNTTWDGINISLPCIPYPGTLFRLLLLRLPPNYSHISSEELAPSFPFPPVLTRVILGQNCTSPLRTSYSSAFFECSLPRSSSRSAIEVWYSFSLFLQF